MLLAYFGESSAKKCGICDYCLQINRKDASGEEFAVIQAAISRILDENRCSDQELMEKMASFPEMKVLFVIRTLLDEGQLARDPESGHFFLPKRGNS